ncbi:MAG: hypothetical protein KAH57_05935 [Thermoplasmata archaeon]|nr:hypothetical protein [Thermoplasmata archaeon]
MNGNDRVVIISGVVVLLLMLTTAMVFRGDVAAGIQQQDDSVDLSWMSDLPVESGTDTQSQKLNEGSEAQFPIPGEGRAIKEIRATLTWVDEPDIRRARLYENQPDSFTLAVASGDGNISGTISGANSADGKGSLLVQVTLTDEEIDQFMDSGDWSVIVTLDTAQDYEPRLGPGVIVLTDNGNDFSLTIEYDYYDLSPEGEE